MLVYMYNIRTVIWCWWVICVGVVSLVIHLNSVNKVDFSAGVDAIECIIDWIDEDQCPDSDKVDDDCAVCSFKFTTVPSRLCKYRCLSRVDCEGRYSMHTCAQTSRTLKAPLPYAHNSTLLVSSNLDL